MSVASRSDILPELALSRPLPSCRPKLRCPVCLGEMTAIDPLETSAKLTCSSCGFVLSARGNIWRALAPEREERFRQFVLEYQKVRAQEGRGSSDPAFYLALPYEDLTGRYSWQWEIRGRSFRFFEKRLLPQIAQTCGPDLDILDLGAGNCWMSYRLALRGRRPVAVDLLDNPEDGLGAAEHYFPHLEKQFPRFQAEFDRLPFAAGQFDLAIFNASFHYSEDYERTLHEAIRCLRLPGHVIVLDSPVYRCEESGRQMVEERQAEFMSKFGFASNSIASREFMTGETLEHLARTCRVSWKVLKPWYGLKWALRPLSAKLWGQREPSRFFVLWAEVVSA